MPFIRNTDRERVNGIKPLTYFLIPLIFTFQFIGEGDFYGKLGEKLFKYFINGKLFYLMHIHNIFISNNFH